MYAVQKTSGLPSPPHTLTYHIIIGRTQWDPLGAVLGTCSTRLASSGYASGYSSPATTSAPRSSRSGHGPSTPVATPVAPCGCAGGGEQCTESTDGGEGEDPSSRTAERTAAATRPQADGRRRERRHSFDGGVRSAACTGGGEGEHP